MTFELDADLALHRAGSGLYTTHISDRWSINTTPNGGYVMALAAKALLDTHDTDRPGAIVTASYISRCLPGDAQIEVETISDTSSFRRGMAKIIQQDTEKVRVLGTFLKKEEQEAFVRYDAQPPEVAAFDDCFRIPAMNRNSLFDQVDLRFDPTCVDWFPDGRPGEMAFKGWLKFLDERPLDILSIFLFADAFPPPVFRAYGPKAWVPTVELSVNVRKIPEGTTLKAEFKSRFISSGFVEEDGLLWDRDGDLVAVSRQYSLYKIAPLK